MFSIIIRCAYALLLLFLFGSCKAKTSVAVSLGNTIQTQIDSIAGDVAVAFYNLSDPQDNLMIDENEKFHAASTMKVPVMIELFKQAENGKLNLNDSILLENEFKSIVDGSPYSMDISDDSDDIIYSQIGKKISLNDLMYSMITVSSNLATNLLIEIVGAKKITETMRDLDAQNMEVLRGVEDQKAYDQGLSNSTTAKDLMLIMKAIANHSAGTKKDCETMIGILKEQKFNDIIPLYLPKNVSVAHKTGFISGLHHDAAIVFLPDGRSYILVLLSKNLQDFDQGTKQLAKLSKTVYDHIWHQE